MKLKLKVGDVVKVIAGSHKGEQGPISKFSKDRSRVYVNGIKGIKHQKPTQDGKEGGIIQIDISVDISNIALIDPKNKSSITKVGYKIVGSKKTRIAKKSGNSLK